MLKMATGVHLIDRLDAPLVALRRRYLHMVSSEMRGESAGKRAIKMLRIGASFFLRSAIRSRAVLLWERCNRKQSFREGLEGTSTGSGLRVYLRPRRKPAAYCWTGGRAAARGASSLRQPSETWCARRPSAVS